MPRRPCVQVKMKFWCVSVPLATWCPSPYPPAQTAKKIRYIPGIYDSVELILSGSPRILRVQAVPDINTKSATIHAWIRQGEKPAAAKLSFIVREAVSGKTVGESTCTIPATGEGPERTGQPTSRSPGASAL